MRAQVLALLAGWPALAFGGYTYDYPVNLNSPNPSQWAINGGPSFTAPGVTFGGNGGSMMLTATVPGASPYDYEINTTLALKSAGGVYIHFVRASSGSDVAGTGNYVSAEIDVPTPFNSPGLATLNINQCTNGSVTNLSSTVVTINDGMTLRSVAFGQTLFVYINNLLVFSGTPLSVGSGQPGIGGYSVPSGSGFSAFAVGHHDTIAPGVVSATTAASSVLPSQVSIRWQGVVDDANGIGLGWYTLERDDGWAAQSVTPSIVDDTVIPGTTYVYTINAEDYHGNVSASAPITITAPLPQSVDPRRVGTFTTGSYWGGGGEQIDTLSGNLNFSLPLLTAQGRSGWTVPVGLSYNSQNWRQDNGVNWQLGDDTGYGFGWQAQIGSVTPYYVTWWTGPDHFVYTDGTGAQYRLDQNNNGVWSSLRGIYVWYDSTANLLHFPGGTFWVMGCTSGGTEADAGTMYPTVIEDVSGNEVLVSYQAGAGLPVSSINTSARITAIADARATAPNCAYNLETNSYGACMPPSYTFIYNSDSPVPHLTGVISDIGTYETYTFSYSEASLGPPFGADPGWTGQTTSHLATMNAPATGTYQFTYDSAGAGELDEVAFLYGGHLRWVYQSFQYSGARTVREVASRYVSADSAGATEWGPYTLTRPDAPNSVTVHSSMTLTDASGNGAKIWNFFSPLSGTAWQIGLIADFAQRAAAGATTAFTHDYYTWSMALQGPAGNPYISVKASVMDEGSANVTAVSSQTLDTYGNLTQAVIYPFNNTSAPLKTYNNTYLNAAGYAHYYIFNRLLTSTLTMGGTTRTLVTNYYDGQLAAGQQYPSTTCYFGPGGALQAGGGTPTMEFDASQPVPYAGRGQVSASVNPAKFTCSQYYIYGFASAVSSDGTSVTAASTASTNYAAPSTITTQSYGETIAYNSWLGITQTTGLNGETLYLTYDSYGRPSTAVSPYGATTSYSYSTSPPVQQIKNGPDGLTRTTLDGLGRTIRVERGSSTGYTSAVDTVYAPCACSPLGKVQKVSAPYPEGQSATNWTVYSYDGIGRTLTLTQPDGASTTTYSYAGNQTTVTDPAGNWKTFTNDVLGNLISVTEPSPVN